jgi:transcription elongation factor GreA
MYDELTAVDLAKMREEIDYRVKTLRPQLVDEVKTARAFGDLSENFEYKAAKRDKNRNDSRVRYLENMIKTAHVISGESRPGEIGLFDTVELYFEEDDETQTIQIVTTLRQNTLKGLISKESPLGSVLMGHKPGDRVWVQVNETIRYEVVIR